MVSWVSFSCSKARAHVPLVSSVATIDWSSPACSCSDDAKVCFGPFHKKWTALLTEHTRNLHHHRIDVFHVWIGLYPGPLSTSPTRLYCNWWILFQNLDMTKSCKLIGPIYLTFLAGADPAVAPRLENLIRWVALFDGCAACSSA